jgi:hypothetical protein
MAVESVNAHLEPMRERRRQLAEHPQRLQEIIQKGAQKAGQAAEETMVAAREAVGLLGLRAVREIPVEQKVGDLMRVPPSATNAGNEQERNDIVIDAWVERVSKVHPLRKDRPRTFITRKGRKVGIHTAQRKQSGLWEFSFADRPLNVIVLLAEDEGHVRDYILPPKVLQEYWKKFQRRDDLVEITAKKSANDVSLLVDGNNLPIQQYEGNYAALE